MKPVPITRQGFESLKQELNQLRKIERPKNIKAIEEARAHGDLSENAEFNAAKERQSFLDARINELEYKLANAEVIDPDSLSKDRAVFGCTVVLENIDTGDEVTYQLVGPEESNIKEGRISVASPLGKAIVGKQLGEEIVINAPGGRRNYELIDIV
ncbi:MAG: transcription elongation factor GreA [Desulfobacteraceae bacterium]|nr:transcription elongation factor GreA [Desulfobacteraceae bacterium]